MLLHHRSVQRDKSGGGAPPLYRYLLGVAKGKRLPSVELSQFGFEQFPGLGLHIGELEFAFVEPGQQGFCTW